MVRKAADADYQRPQGGRPSIRREGKLWSIDHSSSKEEGKKIRTHISPQERGTVIVDGVEYNTAELCRFEGASCERQSRLVGGKGYETGSGGENKG